MICYGLHIEHMLQKWPEGDVYAHIGVGGSMLLRSLGVGWSFIYSDCCIALLDQEVSEKQDE